MLITKLVVCSVILCGLLNTYVFAAPEIRSINNLSTLLEATMILAVLFWIPIALYWQGWKKSESDNLAIFPGLVCLLFVAPITYSTFDPSSGNTGSNAGWVLIMASLAYWVLGVVTFSWKRTAAPRSDA